MSRPSSLLFAVTFALLAALACDAASPAGPVSGEEETRIKAELQDRSFRQFEHSRDADRRKGVILDFFGPISIWAQNAEDGRAVNEWEILSDDYRIEGDGSGSEITIYLDRPRSAQTFPTECDDCIPTDNVSISIRNVLKSDNISFKLNDPDGNLPSPFPVFQSWTKFTENEYMD